MNRNSCPGLYSAILAIAALAVWPIAAIASANARQPESVGPRRIPLDGFLYGVARRFDVYFTLETKQPAEGTESPIELVEFSSDDLKKYFLGRRRPQNIAGKTRRRCCAG